MTSASRAGGTSGRRRRSGSASRSITAASTWAGVSRRKTGRPGGHLVEDEAERELVGAVVQRPSAGLLRRHVLEGAEQHPRLGAVAGQRLAGVDVLQDRGHDLGQPEVEDLQDPVGGDHQVLRLQVAMDDAGAVRLGQAVGELRAEAQHLGDGQGPGAETLADGLAFHQLHDHVVRALESRRPRRRRRCGRCSGGSGRRRRAPRGRGDAAARGRRRTAGP